MDEQADRYEKLQFLLVQLEGELGRLGLWEEEPPDHAALQSSAPFHYDTLMLHQWLQWVFLPTLDEMTKQGEPLPEKSDIASYAHVVLAHSDRDTQELMEILRTLDEAIGAH